MPASGKQINLLRGWPAPALLPTTLLSAACQRVLANADKYTEMQEYGSCAGLTRLRNGLANWLGRHYGVNPDPERICITGGASPNLVTILQCFSDVNYTRAVWIVAPCYHLVCGIFEDSGFGGKLHAVAEDDEGPDLEALELNLARFEREDKENRNQKVILDGNFIHLANTSYQPFKLPSANRKLYRHLIYAVPTCSNPSGVTMTLERREGLVKLARRYDALIISDDVYEMLQWPLSAPVTSDRPCEMRLPRLCDIDRALPLCDGDGDGRGFGNTVSNASFTKIAGPSVRTGWAEASPALIAGIAHAAATRSGGAPSQLCAAMLADIVENGELPRFVDETLRPALQRRHRLMMDAIYEHLSPLGAKVRAGSLKGHDIYGGYFVWVDVKSEFSTTLIADVLRAEQDIVVGHGQMFAVHGDEEGAKFTNSIRLSFSWEAEQDIVDGVGRIGETLGRMSENRDYYIELASKFEKRGLH